MKLIKLFVDRNKTAFIAAVIIFLAGSVVGAVSSCRIDPSEADMLKEYISPYLDSDAVSYVNRTAIFSADTANHIKFASAAVLCSLSTFFVPVFAFVLGLKGYQLGFAMGFVSAHFGAEGIALAIVTCVVTYWLAIPVYLIMFVRFMRFSAEMKNNLPHMTVRERRREYIVYFVSVLIGCSLLCASAGIGAVLTPFFAGFMN